jgi:hypothetical protein
MIWFIVMHLFSSLLDWVRIGQLTEQEKDLEILLLRRQLGIAQRKLNKPVRSSRGATHDRGRRGQTEVSNWPNNRTTPSGQTHLPAGDRSAVASPAGATKMDAQSRWPPRQTQGRSQASTRRHPIRRKESRLRLHNNPRRTEKLRQIIAPGTIARTLKEKQQTLLFRLGIEKVQSKKARCIQRTFLIEHILYSAGTTGFGHFRVQDSLCSSPDRSRHTWVRSLHFLAAASRDAVS